LQPYVIRQGDYLASLAYQFGFDADTVWSDPANSALRKLRPNPNFLWPTDILYIPSPTAPAMKSLQTGTTNSFVADAPSVSITIAFSDASFASQACSIQELPQLTGLTTDASGTLTFSAPVTMDTATIAFSGIGATYVFKIGHLDPIETLSGVFQRLQNLGFIASDADFDPTDLEFLRTNLRALNAAQTGGGSGPASSSPSPSAAPSSANPPSEPAPSSDPAPPSNPAPQSEPSPPQDNAGLSDDGTLDSSTSTMLLNAHGS
jgi:hypothetical protein